VVVTDRPSSPMVDSPGLLDTLPPPVQPR
jgi:hypothetical protein